MGIPFGGIGYRSQVKVPVVVTVPTHHYSRGSSPYHELGDEGKGESAEVAFFTVVVDECWQWANGSTYLDGCTCGPNVR